MDYFEKFRQLLLATPRHHLTMALCENCDYNVFLYASKNCYMCRGSSYLEDSFYCNISQKLKTSGDCAYCRDSELLYECIDCEKSYNCSYSQDCKNCVDCEWCYDCIGTQNCFGCVGLRRGQYLIFNEQYTREEYARKLADLRRLPQSVIEESFEALKKRVPRLYIHGHTNENSTGDYLVECKNCSFSYGAEKCEDCVYIYEEMVKSRDSVDLTHSHNAELCYDGGTQDNNYNCNFMFWATYTRDSEFCYCVHASENLFMSTYRQHKKFQIFNEQYEEAEYHKKTAEIKAWLRERNLYGQNLIYLALKDTPEVAQFFTWL